MIIDEPEAHLNPKYQKILVKYLVMAMNKGLKIIITTHSDYILDQLNFMIKLNNISNSEDKNRLMEKWGYDDSSLLNMDDINIYSFRQSENYVFIPENLEINELGIQEDDFVKIVNEFYDESDDITEILLGEYNDKKKSS